MRRCEERASKIASVGGEGTNCPGRTVDIVGVRKAKGKQQTTEQHSSQVAVDSRFIGIKQSASLKVNYHGCNQFH